MPPGMTEGLCSGRGCLLLDGHDLKDALVQSDTAGDPPGDLHGLFVAELESRF